MQTTSTPQAGERTQSNEREFPTIKGALMALESLEEKIAEIREAFESNKSDEGINGWVDSENFGEFAHNMLTDDREFLRNLVNLGLILA